MSEKKVATRQERLIFENLIKQDMQRGIRRSSQLSQKENQNNFQSKSQQNIPCIIPLNNLKIGDLMLREI